METPERLLLFSTPNPHPELSSPETPDARGFFLIFIVITRWTAFSLASRDKRNKGKGANRS